MLSQDKICKKYILIRTNGVKQILESLKINFEIIVIIKKKIL